MKITGYIYKKKLNDVYILMRSIVCQAMSLTSN